MFSCKRFLARALVSPVVLSVVVSLVALLGALARPLVVAAPSVASAQAAPASGRDQDAQVLMDYVAQFLQTQTRAAHGGALQIHVEAPRTKGLAPCDALQAIHSKGSKGLRPRTSIQVRCLAPQTWSVYVQANLALSGVYYAATRSVAPGETVGPDDLRAVQADLLRLPADTITDAAQAIGRVATQRIRKGSAIKSGVLRDAQSIQRGQRVHTEARGSGFIMRGTGQALQGGAPGSTIQVRTASGQLISGIVVDAGTVRVPM